MGRKKIERPDSWYQEKAESVNVLLTVRGWRGKKEYARLEIISMFKDMFPNHPYFRTAAETSGLLIKKSRGMYTFTEKNTIHWQLLKRTYELYELYRKNGTNTKALREQQRLEEQQHLEAYRQQRIQYAINLLKKHGYLIFKQEDSL
jgi:hypothetical protein